MRLNYLTVALNAFPSNALPIFMRWILNHFSVNFLPFRSYFSNYKMCNHTFSGAKLKNIFIPACIF